MTKSNLPWMIDSELDKKLWDKVEPQGLVLKENDFVMGVYKAPGTQEGWSQVEVWGPAQFQAEEQSWRAQWWIKFALVYTASVALVGAFGYYLGTVAQ